MLIYWRREEKGGRREERGERRCIKSPLPASCVDAYFLMLQQAQA